MQVLILRDRKPGHSNQAEGLAVSLELVTPTSVQRLEVRRRVLAANFVMKFAMKHLARNMDRCLRLLYGFDSSQLTPPALIVGSGRPTIAAGILLARRYGAKFIFSGQIAGYDLSGIAALMLVHSPRFAFDPDCCLAPIPCVVSAENHKSPRLFKEEADLQGAEFSLFVGGKAHGYHYTETEWKRLTDLVIALSERFGIRWSVTTSRRSPQSLGPLFESLVARQKIVRFVDYRHAGPGSASSLFGADAIVVTEDSLSMMAEGVAAGRKVIALRPKSVASSYANEVVSAAVTRGGLAILPLAATTPDHFARTLFALDQPVVNPRQMIADAISSFLNKT